MTYHRMDFCGHLVPADQIHMHRRDFICCLVVSGLAFFARTIRHTGSIESAPAIKNIPPGFDIHSLANEYLKAFPQFADRSLLAAIVAAEASTPESMKRAIADQFDRGATLTIGNWVYADIELKLCVLHARKWI